MQLSRIGDIDAVKYGIGKFNVLFLARNGGFSAQPYESLNMSYSVGDKKGRVNKNFDKVMNAFSLEEKELVPINQVHHDEILIIRKGDNDKKSIWGNQKVATGDYDGVVTDDLGLCLSLLTADCVPVMFFDPKKNVIACAHAGWRGTALCISKKVVQIMVEYFSCDKMEIRAAIGPSIARCCYEVSDDVLERLLGSVNSKPGGALYRSAGGKHYADLKRINEAQLREAGLLAANIHIDSHCTLCDSKLFFSYRREQKTGRQMSLVFTSEAQA